jgi:hypothetical protein
MRFVYIFLFILAVINLILIVLSGLLNINIYSKYGKNILKGVFKILLVFVIAYIAFILAGLTA